MIRGFCFVTTCDGFDGIYNFSYKNFKIIYI